MYSKQTPHNFHVPAGKVRCIGMTSEPLRLFIAYDDMVRYFYIADTKRGSVNAQGSGEIQIRNVSEIRALHSSIILCSPSEVRGYEYVAQSSVWRPQFAFRGNYISHAQLVHNSKLVILSQRDQTLRWQVYDYLNITKRSSGGVSSKMVHFTSANSWEHKDTELKMDRILDISNDGLCLISSRSGELLFLDLMKKNGDSVSSILINNEDEYDGTSCFLRSCDVPGHFAPLFMCGKSKVDLKVFQKTELGEVKILRNWESKSTNPFGDPAFTNPFAYSNGVALIWNSAGDNNLPTNGSGHKDRYRSTRTVSAVLLFDYADQQECRFNYPSRHYIKGDENDFYLPGKSLLTQENEAYSGLGDDSPLEGNSDLDDVSVFNPSVEREYDSRLEIEYGSEENSESEDASESE